MKSKITAIFLAVFFMAASTLLPLGDFSLMTDLPSIYRTYTKVADPHEAGIIDFIGDYLLNGKTILGHNKHDQSAKAGSDLQFQRAANFTSYFQQQTFYSYLDISEYCEKHPLIDLPFSTSDFHAELLRPPLTVIG